MGTAQKIATGFGLQHVSDAAKAAGRTGLPFHVACALLQMESGGRNVWGNDAGGVFAGSGDREVTEADYREFRRRIDDGEPSNGVGPCQITHKSFFPKAEQQGLRLWVPLDNMVFGFGMLAVHHAATGSWRRAGTGYNGKASYGEKFARRVGEWQRRLTDAQPGESPTDPTTSVSLANVIAAARKDPKAPQGVASHPADVRPVEAALRAEGLLAAAFAADGAFGTATREAYAKWQRKLDMSGDDADGIPGRTSLTELGERHGFTVT